MRETYYRVRKPGETLYLCGVQHDPTYSKGVWGRKWGASETINKDQAQTWAAAYQGIVEAC